MLSRARIQRCIPHAGAMCLLDVVQRWDGSTIVCRAAAPGAKHPLARMERLPAVATVEYAAQAAAVHGALLDGADAPRAGMLAKLADVELPAPLLREDGGDLIVQAELLGRNASGCMYRFEVRDDRACVARGRLLVAFPA